MLISLSLIDGEIAEMSVKQIKNYFMFALFFTNTCLSESLEENFHSQGKTFQDCYEASLKQTTSIPIQQELIKQAEATYNQAFGSSLPNISAVKNFGWPKAETGKSSFTSSNVTVESDTKLMLTQPLFQGFKEFAARKEAKALIHASEYDKKEAAILLYHNVASSFYTTLSLEVDIENANEELGHYERRIKELKEFIRIGRSQLTDQLTTSSQAQALRAQIKQLKGALLAQRSLLSYLTSLDVNVPLQYSKNINSKARQLQEYLINIDQRPDVLGNVSRQEASDEAVSIAKGNHWPSLFLQGDYFVERRGVYKTDWDIMLNLTVPIFSWGTVSAQVDESISKRTQATLQLNETKRQAEQEIRRYYETYIGDREGYLGFDDATKLAQKVYEADIRDYKRGLVTNLDVLQALITFQESKRARDRAYFSMLIDLEFVESAGGFKPIQK